MIICDEKIGVVGAGFVGQSIIKGFSTYVP